MPNGTQEGKAEACKDIYRWVIPCEIKVAAEMIEYAEKLQVIGRA
ncbi:MAG: hypothetical protein ACKVJJ_05535 [Fidelibacterota bacterium]